MKKSTKIAAACIGVIAGCIACGHILREVRYEVETEKLTAPVKIAFLSDVHNSFYGNGQSELVRKIDEFGADLVMLGGDLFDEHNGEENSWALIDALAAEYPCFYAIGNHELRTGKAEYYKEELARRGVTVLAGESRLITVNGQTLRVCGAEGRSDGTLEAAQKELDGAYSVLLYHYPEDFPTTSKLGFDLILSGHAHGGQWRIPGLLNGLYSPGEGLFPKYAGGRYDFDGGSMLVSRGLYRNLSCVFIPRIFNNPELLLITLKPS